MIETEQAVVQELGAREMPSPLRRDARTAVDGTFVSDSTFVRLPIEIDTAGGESEQLFEKAGPREKIFFDPSPH